MKYVLPTIGLLLLFVVSASAETGTPAPIRFTGAELVQQGDTETYNGWIAEEDLGTYWGEDEIENDWTTGVYETRLCTYAQQWDAILYGELDNEIIFSAPWESCENSYNTTFNATFDNIGLHTLYVVMIQTRQEWQNSTWVVTQPWTTIAVEDYKVFAEEPISEPSIPPPPNFEDLI